MSIIFLIAAQAMGPEIKTFHPLPPKAQQERELEQAQGLLPEPAPAPVQAPAADKPVAPKADTPKPPEEPVKVTSVTKVAPDAVVVFVPPKP